MKVTGCIVKRLSLRNWCIYQFDMYQSNSLMLMQKIFIKAIEGAITFKCT